MEKQFMTAPHFITSLQHPYVKHLVRLREDSSYRFRERAFLLEGIKAIQEAASSIKRLAYTSAYLPFLKLQAKEEWHVTEEIMKKVCSTVTPEGVVAEMYMPPFSELNKASSILALDGVSDPGNLGTLMRTALALGWEGIFLLPNCCDPYNEKVLRAARGAHFKIPMQKGTFEELRQLAEEGDFQPLVASLQGISPDKIPSSGKKILVLGNEARGPSQKIQGYCSPVAIPMPGEMESLNVAVAGGILLYLLKRQ